MNDNGRRGITIGDIAQPGEKTDLLYRPASPPQAEQLAS